MLRRRTEKRAHVQWDAGTDVGREKFYVHPFGQIGRNRIHDEELADAMSALRECAGGCIRDHAAE